MSTNRSKAKGTQGETDVARYLAVSGFPHVERSALRGNSGDVGDLTGTPGLAWQIKVGAAAEVASDLKIAEWMSAAEDQRIAAGAHLGILVTKRAGYGKTQVGMWWARITLQDVHDLSAGQDVCVCILPEPFYSMPVRLRLDHAVLLLRYGGYGEPLSPAERGVMEEIAAPALTLNVRAVPRRFPTSVAAAGYLSPMAEQVSVQGSKLITQYIPGAVNYHVVPTEVGHSIEGVQLAQYLEDLAYLGQHSRTQGGPLRPKLLVIGEHLAQVTGYIRDHRAELQQQAWSDIEILTNTMGDQLHIMDRLRGAQFHVLCLDGTLPRDDVAWAIIRASVAGQDITRTPDGFAWPWPPVAMVKDGS